jgi:hypothetical protein
MRPGDLEPNYHYRPWLEDYVGEQGIDWQWKIHSAVDNTLEIDFINLEDALLFELSWK